MVSEDSDGLMEGISPTRQRPPFTIESTDFNEREDLAPALSFTKTTSFNSFPSQAGSQMKSRPPPPVVFVRPKSPPGTPRFVPLPGTSIQKRLTQRHYGRHRRGDVRGKFDYDNASGCRLATESEETERVVCRSNFTHICASISIDTTMLGELQRSEEAAEAAARKQGKKSPSADKKYVRLKANDSQIGRKGGFFTKEMLRAKVKRPDALSGRTGIEVSGAGAGCYSLPYETVADLYVDEGRRRSMTKPMSSFVLKEQLTGQLSEHPDEDDYELEEDDNEEENGSGSGWLARAASTLSALSGEGI